MISYIDFINVAFYILISKLIILFLNIFIVNIYVLFIM